MDYAAFCEKEGYTFPFSENLDILKESVQLGNKTAPNRIVYHPMEGCDGERSGVPGELTRRRYLRFAAGGAGIIWFEAVACMQKARANPRQLFLTEDNIAAFQKLNDEMREICMKENGFAPLIILQDTHSGRYSKPNGVPEPIIVRNNPYLEKNGAVDPSRIITDEELDQGKEALIHTAYLAEKAGFDGVDIKCNHCYLARSGTGRCAAKGRGLFGNLPCEFV